MFSINRCVLRHTSESVHVARPAELRSSGRNRAARHIGVWGAGCRHRAEPAGHPPTLASFDCIRRISRLGAEICAARSANQPGWISSEQSRLLYEKSFATEGNLEALVDGGAGLGVCADALGGRGEGGGKVEVEERREVVAPNKRHRHLGFGVRRPAVLAVALLDILLEAVSRWRGIGRLGALALLERVYIVQCLADGDLAGSQDAVRVGVVQILVQVDTTPAGGGTIAGETCLELGERLGGATFERVGRAFVGALVAHAFDGLGAARGFGILTPLQLLRTQRGVLRLRHNGRHIGDALRREAQPEPAGKKTSSDPGGEDVGKVELDLGVGIALNGSANVDERLHGSRVDVADRAEIKDHGAQGGACVAHGSKRIRVIEGVLAASAGDGTCSLDEIGQVRGVRIGKGLFEAVDEHAGRGRLDVDRRVAHAVLVVERHKHVAVGERDGRLVGRGGTVVNTHDAEPSTAGAGNADEQQRKRSSHRHVHTRLGAREDGGNHCTHKDDQLERVDQPELVRHRERHHQVRYGVDDDGRQNRVGDPVECAAERVDGDEHQDTGEPTGKRGAHARLGLDGRSRKRTRSRISAEARTDEVGDADGNELLVGVDLVVVEAAERLCDGDVLEQQHHHRHRQAGSKVREQARVEDGLADVLESTRHGEQDGDGVLLGVRVVAEPNAGSHSKDDDDESVTQHRDEEHGAGGARVSRRQPSAEPLDPVKEDERGQTKGRVDVGVGQSLERVDDDLIGGVAVGLHLGQAEQLGHLTGGNLDSRARHETSHGGCGDEFDDKAETKQTDAETDDTAEEGEGGGDGLGRPFARVRQDVLHHIERLQRHDGDGTDGDILGRGEDGVDHDADERRVETELGLEACELCVRHGLRNDDERDGDTGDDVADEPLGVVRSDPLAEGEEAVEIVVGLGARVAEDVAEPVAAADDGHADAVDLVVVVADRPLEGVGAALAERGLLILVLQLRSHDERRPEHCAAYKTTATGRGEGV
ncbi:hypothetical protein L1887_46831 [Cichorium endivia]|nr:hypothetical protein L1887_46831 [Cichorium endivia]